MLSAGKTATPNDRFREAPAVVRSVHQFQFQDGRNSIWCAIIGDAVEAPPSRKTESRLGNFFLQLSFFIFGMTEKYPGSESGPREWFGHRADIPHAAPRQEAKCQGESVRFFLGETLL